MSSRVCRSRAGASSVTELQVAGRPAILIPFAAAADDHQNANAEGLTATPDTNSFSVSYTSPATPTVVVSASSALGKITITPPQPTPGGGQPTVTSIDIFVRLSSAHTSPDL